MGKMLRTRGNEGKPTTSFFDEDTLQKLEEDRYWVGAVFALEGAGSNLLQSRHTSDTPTRLRNGSISGKMGPFPIPSRAAYTFE